MRFPAERKGLVLFGAILLIVLVAAFAAYRTTGSMGIEDRYQAAVGLPPAPDVGGTDAFFGFSAEGNPVQYAIVLLALIALCYLAYAKYRI